MLLEVRERFACWLWRDSKVSHGLTVKRTWIPVPEYVIYPVDTESKVACNYLRRHFFVEPTIQSFLDGATGYGDRANRRRS